MGAEKYFFPGGAGEKIHLILFRLLREPEVCDAFFAFLGVGRGRFLFCAWGVSCKGAGCMVQCREISMWRKEGRK